MSKAEPGTKWTWGVKKLVGPLVAANSDSDTKKEASLLVPVSTPVADDNKEAQLSAEAASKKQAEKAPSAKEAPTAGPTSAALAYPTSSKHGPKNWDSLGDDEGDDADKDVNGFFKELYANSTPDQQRAMMKSFTESNGTALSTDWNDVKTHTVKTTPPDGVEAKKW